MSQVLGPEMMEYKSCGKSRGETENSLCSHDNHLTGCRDCSLFLVALFPVAYSLSNSVLRGSSGLRRASSRIIWRATLVVQMRHGDLNGDNFVAALSGVLRALDATLPHAQLLSALRAGRNLQLRAAIDGGHSTLAPSELGHRDRDGDHECHLRRAKNRIRTGADNKKEVACGAAVYAGVALALQADALAVARAGLDAEFDSFGTVDSAFAVASGAVVARYVRCRCSAGK